MGHRPTASGSPRVLPQADVSIRILGDGAGTHKCLELVAVRTRSVGISFQYHSVDLNISRKPSDVQAFGPASTLQGLTLTYPGS